MSIEGDISDALTNRVLSMVFDPVLTVGYPNAHFTPPADGSRWLEMKHFRNTNLSPTWGDEKTLLGILQIDINDPSKLGEMPVTLIASKIMTDYFPKGTNLFQGDVCVSIYTHPTLLTVIETEGKAIFPVSIPYRCWKP